MKLKEYKFSSIQESKEMIDQATKALDYFKSVTPSNSMSEFMIAYSNSLIRCHYKFIKEYT